MVSYRKHFPLIFVDYGDIDRGIVNDGNTYSGIVMLEPTDADMTTMHIAK